MDMDIQFTRSQILFSFRVVAALGALYAVSIAGVSVPARLMIILLLVLQFWRWIYCANGISGFAFEHENLIDSGDQQSRVNLVLKLSDGRWLQVHLTHFYCLWWIQILELRSVSGRHTLIVLPDSCGDSDRHYIRTQLLSGKLNFPSAKP